MAFAKWLEEQLNKRGWSQRDLIKYIRLAGYQLSPGQLSRIMAGTRQANPEACIGIAHALGIPREEVFKARGWLLSKSEELFDPEIDPRARQLAKEVSALPFDSRDMTLDAMEAVFQTSRQLTSKIQQLAAVSQQA